MCDLDHHLRNWLLPIPRQRWLPFCLVCGLLIFSSRKRFFFSEKNIDVFILFALCLRVFDRQLRWEDLVVSTTYNNQTTNNHVVTSTTTAAAAMDSGFIVGHLVRSAMPDQHTFRQQHLYTSRKVSKIKVKEKISRSLYHLHRTGHTSKTV